MRLAKFLAHAGVCSRRAAEEIVRAGRVSVNGEVVVDPAREITERDRVRLDARAVRPERRRVVYALNKPLGVVSTARDPQGRPTVTSLLDSSLRLYPVGRLDADSTGLILLTNDGELAHRLTHPSFEVEKTYVARVQHPPVRWKAVRALRRGVELEDGMTAPAYVRLLEPDRLEITLHEGRKRQVRRMCEAVGHPVLELQRVRLGPLSLGELKPGSHRLLSEPEVRALREAGAGTAARRFAASSSAGRGRPRRGSRSPRSRTTGA